MKKILVLLLFVPALSFSQGKVIKDTLLLDNGLKFVKGQDLYFGNGSDIATKGYNFIYINPTLLNPVATKLTTGWSGKKMEVAGFKSIGNKKTGYKYYILLSGGAIVKYICDIDGALSSGEVVVKGFQTNNATASGADELKKWKNLLDSGAITQEEYDQQKKKILSSTN